MLVPYELQMEIGTEKQIMNKTKKYMLCHTSTVPLETHLVAKSLMHSA